jgi:hypothetical protein
VTKIHARKEFFMSSRGDIIGKSDYSFDDTKYGLIYTKQCGWIDLGHAYPSNGRGDGALYLWKKILRESSESASGGDDFIVSYHQKMSALKRNISVGIKKRYSIQKGLNLSQKKRYLCPLFSMYQMILKLCRAIGFSETSLIVALVQKI